MFQTTLYAMVASPMRFAILHHTGILSPHFDLLIETSPDALLLTFRLQEWPIAAPADILRQPDHRRLYLDYEGPISNNRGHVRRVAAGECTLSTFTPTSIDLTLHLTPPLHLHLTHREADHWHLAVG